MKTLGIQALQFFDRNEKEKSRGDNLIRVFSKFYLYLKSTISMGVHLTSGNTIPRALSCSLCNLKIESPLAGL